MNETVERLSKAFSIQKLPRNPEIQKKRDELLQCYQQNPGKTLLCSEVVKDFSRSVHSSRTVSLQKCLKNLTNFDKISNTCEFICILRRDF